MGMENKENTHGSTSHGKKLQLGNTNTLEEKFTIGFWNVGSVKTPNDKPEKIEKAMIREKCDVFVITEAKRPAAKCFNKNELAKGFGWGKLHDLDAYWIGSSTCTSAINGVMVAFSDTARKAVDKEPASFSDHNLGGLKGLGKATNTLAAFVCNLFNNNKTTPSAGTRWKSASCPDICNPAVSKKLEQNWTAYLTKQFFEDLETRMLHVRLRTKAGIVNIFGCYVATDNNTKEHEQCAIIFFLKLNRIIEKEEQRLLEEGKKEFVIVCGDMNTLVDQNDSGQSSTGTPKAKPRQRNRTTLFEDFCNEHGFKIAKFEDGSLATYVSIDKDKKVITESFIDHLAYGWIGVDKNTYNGKVPQIWVDVHDDPLSQNPKNFHRLCVAEVDLSECANNTSP